MVTRSPASSDTTTPTKPKKVWKPKTASADTTGVPSLFASATLNKPLKVNQTVVTTILRKSKSETGSSAPSLFRGTKAEYSSSAAAATATPKPKSPPPPTTKTAGKPKRNLSNSSDESEVLVSGSEGGMTVAGTPQSWPKPHAVEPRDKPVVKARHMPNNTKGRPSNIDDLIPDMYRKKNTKQLEEEQQEEIETMMRIMYELKRAERERQELALQPKPIGKDVKTVLGVLEAAKRRDYDEDSHSSLDSDDENKPKRNASAYSTHMKSKIAFFTSNHSVDTFDLDSDDSSVSSSDSSSWDSDSDSDDGILFRG